jgi:hypothetical protein
MTDPMDAAGRLAALRTLPVCAAQAVDRAVSKVARVASSGCSEVDVACKVRDPREALLELRHPAS